MKKPRPAPRVAKPKRRAVKPTKPDLTQVRSAPPRINRTAPPQYVVEKAFYLSVEPIAGLVEGELDEILKREGVKKSYDVWREAKAEAMVLSTVGGIKSVTIESRKLSVTRGEKWENGACVSMDGGVTKLVKPEKETE
jgi:hypothetical protein